MRSLTLESGLKNSSFEQHVGEGAVLFRVRFEPHERGVADGFGDVVMDA